MTVKNGSTTLEEKGKNVNMEVIVDGIKDPIIQIRLAGTSKINHLSVLSNKVICDYILIASVNNTLYAIFIELKTKLENDDKPYEQLRVSRSLLDYFLSVYEIEHGIKINPEVKYALIYTKEEKNLNIQRIRSISHRKRYRKGIKKYKSIDIYLLKTTYLTIDECV